MSVATASRALSNPDLVAEDTRKSVLDAAASCGYRVNLLARSLRKRRTDTLLVLIPEINNEFYPEIITSMEHRAHAEGFAMILGLTENQLEREHSYFELLGAQRADGL
ncbi:MAG: LacI family DNA-binding transcriptional regulator, partial [Alphaproteobacteria bacterium]|nr:LacI family DNA-binding transcriptional regulator [Alphaproteobacteria bacterium]